MRVEVEEPQERIVIIDMTESEAALLRDVLSYVYLASPEQAQGASLISLVNQLVDADLVQNVPGVNLTTRGVRVYDRSTEW